MGKLLHLPVRRRLEIDLKTNTIVCGDNIDWLKEIPSNSIHMCYIDPPFFTNKNYEIIWGNGYEKRSFDDRWKGGIKSYIVWMEERVKQIHRVLKPTGCIFLHCDWRASHRLRVMLDDVFDEKNFRNEIIWHYSGWNKFLKEYYEKRHDTILFYSKTKKTRLNKVGEHWESKEQYVKIRKQKIRLDDNGNEYVLSDGGKGKRIKRFLDDAMEAGRPLDDVWNIDKINNSDKKERIGYKTQKPEALLKRIIECSTNKGDTILDCFGGGGTTASVAAQLGRKFITGDVSPVAIRVISKRINDLKKNINFDVLNVPRTKEEWLLMNGHDFADRLCSFMGWKSNPKKSSDGGIDGWTANDIPIQIKNHRNRIGRPDIQKFVGALNSSEKGLFVAWDFTPTAWDYVVEAKESHKKTVEFIKVEDILGDILIDSDKKMEIEKLLLDRVSS